jgi:hypothetical protein
MKHANIPVEKHSPFHVKQFNNYVEIHLVIDTRTMQDILLKSAMSLRQMK